MNYKPIIRKLNYWKNYVGSGDEYRKEHDLDCILTGGNLYADTIFSLWLPLRYVLNYFNCTKWVEWKEFEYDVLSKQKMTLKNHNNFIDDLSANIEEFLPEHEITTRLLELFELGQKRCNVMLLPCRQWNTIRGCRPYFDYLPHFLYDLLDTNDLKLKEEIVNWIKVENLSVFFKGGIIEKESILDLAGTGSVYSHSPSRISLLFLIQNYISILKERENTMLVA